MKLQLVTIENPYLCFRSELVRNLFAGLCHLRALGYGPDYPKSYLPFEKHDFIATQHLICEDVSGTLVPVAGFRQSVLSVCDTYNMALPIVSMIGDYEECRDHLLAVEHLVEKKRSMKENLIDSSGLTIRKDLRSNRALSEKFLQIVAALVLYDMKWYGAKASTTLAAMQFKTHLRFASWGYTPVRMSNGKEVLPFVKSCGGMNQGIHPMVLIEPSEFAKNCLQEFKGFIESRVLFSDENELSLNRAA